jgi:hypothetical protein
MCNYTFRSRNKRPVTDPAQRDGNVPVAAPILLDFSSGAGSTGASGSAGSTTGLILQS